MTSSPSAAAKPSVKTAAAASDESVSVPTLKSTRWIGLALRAPLDDADRHGERERGPRPEERGAGERADGADGDRAVVELERERLPHADERDHGEQADHVRRGAEDRADDARARRRPS